MICFPSNEETFDQDQKVKRRNDRWLYANLPEVSSVVHTTFLALDMVLRVAHIEEHVIHRYFFFHKALELTVPPILRS